MQGNYTIQEELSTLKVTLLRLMPFYGDVLMKLPIIEYDAISTAATDGYRIFYNEKYMLALTGPERSFIFMHELFHVIFQHPSRRQERDAKIWNIAADIVVNDLLEKRLSGVLAANGIPIKCPAGGIEVPASEAVSTEAIYAFLVSQMGQKSKNEGNSQKRDNKEPLTTGEIDLRPDLSDNSGDAARKIQSVIKAAKVNNSGGRSPVGDYFIPEEIMTLTCGRVQDWKNILRKFIAEKQSDEISYATPERKYLHMDLILPGQCDADETLENVWAFVDSSASVSREQLETFLRQLYAITVQCGCRLNMAYWDTCVTDVYKNIGKTSDFRDACPHHTGGTNIDCVYEWLNLNQADPDVLLILTDGYCGRLSENLCSKKLKKKTMIVLIDNIIDRSHLDEIGKVTVLGGVK